MEMWSIPFHTIENEWTDDQFFSMFERAMERFDEQEKAAKKARNKKSNDSSGSHSGKHRTSKVGASQFLGQIGAAPPSE